MKVVSVTDIRQDATNLIRRAQEEDEPVLVVQRSRPAAYLVGAAHYDALQTELKELRRAQLLRDVAEAEAEVRHGGLKAYDDVDELLTVLESDAANPHPEIDAPNAR